MRKHIPSLNGLRAISILLVLLQHIDIKNLNGFLSGKYPLLVDGNLGVNVFFVISGFLITTLLLQEEEQAGNISLKGFYIKRAFRIFPVYYTLLFVYLTLQLLNILDFTAGSWLTSLTYTKYLNWHSDWETAHLWSLSVEEQFYFIWPFVFRYAKKHRAKYAFAIIILVPLLRITHQVTQYQWMDFYTIFQRVDAIMWGCVFALYHDKIMPVVQNILSKHKWAIVVPFVVLFSLPLFDVINQRMDLHMGLFIVPLGRTTGTIADIAIGFIMLISIYYRNVWFSLLNTRFMEYIGKLSYSLYIWQQLFFSNKIGPIGKLPLNILLIFVTANISYYLIEKPFLKLRSKVLPG